MRTVLITGAAGNLGRAAVEKFSSEGFFVFAADAPGHGATRETEKIRSVEVDLLDESATEAAIDKMALQHTLDAALLLIGGFAMGGILETDQAALRKMYSLNFETAYFSAKAVLKNMMKQKEGGRIVLVGARPALSAAGSKNMLAYGLSKSLVFKLAEILNEEGREKNVTTHVVVPSVIDTPANRKSMPQADFSAWVKPEEIADAIFYLCSDKGRSVRETVIKMYGRS